MRTNLLLSITILLLIASVNQANTQNDCIERYTYRQNIGEGFYLELNFCTKHPFDKSKIEGGVYWNGIQLGRTDVYWRKSKGYLRVEWTGAYQGIKIYFNPSRRSVNYKLGTQNPITYEWSWWEHSEHLFSY